MLTKISTPTISRYLATVRETKHFKSSFACVYSAVVWMSIYIYRFNHVAWKPGRLRSLGNRRVVHLVQLTKSEIKNPHYLSFLKKNTPFINELPSPRPVKQKHSHVMTSSYVTWCPASLWMSLTFLIRWFSYLARAQIFKHRLQLHTTHISGPFYEHGWTLIAPWINHYIHFNVWDAITYPFLNFNGATVEV